MRFTISPLSLKRVVICTYERTLVLCNPAFRFCLIMISCIWRVNYSFPILAMIEIHCCAEHGQSYLTHARLQWSVQSPSCFFFQCLRNQLTNRHESFSSFRCMYFTLPVQNKLSRISYRSVENGSRVTSCFPEFCAKQVFTIFSLPGSCLFDFIIFFS